MVTRAYIQRGKGCTKGAMQNDIEACLVYTRGSMDCSRGRFSSDLGLTAVFIRESGEYCQKDWHMIRHAST